MRRRREMQLRSSDSEELRVEKRWSWIQPRSPQLQLLQLSCSCDCAVCDRVLSATSDCNWLGCCLLLQLNSLFLRRARARD